MVSTPDNGGSNEATVGPSVFVPQRHPELRQLGSKAIQTSLQQREQYPLKAEDAISQGSTYKPVSLVNSVDFKLLKALIAFETFPDVQEVSELTDDVLLQWLKSQLEETVSITTPEELEVLVKKNVRMKMSEPDSKIRMMTLFMDYYTFWTERNLQHVNDKNTKIAVKHICALLQPAVLKQKIENDLVLDRTELKKDWKDFYAHVLENAVSFEAFYASVLQTGSRTSHSRNCTEQGVDSPPRRGARARYPRSKRLTSTVDPSSETEGKATQPEQRAYDYSVLNPVEPTSKQETPLFLNQGTCPGKRHYLRDCDNTSEDKKRQLLAEYRRKKRQQPLAIKRVRAVDTELNESVQSPHAACSGRIAAVLADCVPVVVSGDYGSDDAALSEEHLTKLAAANVFVPVLPLQRPISVHLAVEGSDDPFIITAERKARISTTLSTMESPFRLRNVEYLVFKESMSEVLLLRPILQSLGFNLEQHLTRVRAQLQDADCSDISFEPNPDMAAAVAQPAGTLSKLLSAEPSHAATYLNESEDESPSDTPSQVPVTASAAEEDRFLDVGKHTHSDVAPHLDRMYNEALDHGLPLALGPRLRRMLDQHKDVFRVKLGSDSPADVPPMNIRLQPGAAPFRAKLRRYSQPQEEFLRKKVQELQNLGLVRRNTQSSWACAPLLVPKPGPERFRFTTDLLPVNKVTMPHAWPMPNLETVLTRLSNKTCFATIDLCQGYWQLPLAETSQECQSFITPDGVYTPTRVMHGQRNAASYCQSTVQDIFRALLDKLLLWLDDILLHDTEPKALLDTIDALLNLCRKYNLKLHAAKCRLFLTAVRWCGRVINSEGVRMDPARLKSLLDMPSLPQLTSSNNSCARLTG